MSSNKNELFSTVLESGYILKILYYSDGPLAVKLVNNKDEFVGQVFISLDNIDDEVGRMSNYTYQLPENDKLKIITKFNAQNPSKSESLTLIGRLMKVM